MRWMLDILAVVAMAAVLGVLLTHTREHQRQGLRRQAVQDALAKLTEQALVAGATKGRPHTAMGYPFIASPTWFASQDAPVNVLAPRCNPWVDMAPTDDLALDPPDPVIVSPHQAGFWYNPGRGVFRARVQPQSSQRATLELYNMLNGRDLKMLPEGFVAARRPVPMFAALAMRHAPKPDHPSESFASVDVQAKP
ncbi:MAG: hypothetical protein IT440_01490 [Phycisphaeraceae bacterium]|nr:hypothetical protein [Phycisphaeraceae bacterium]